MIRIKIFHNDIKLIERDINQFLEQLENDRRYNLQDINIILNQDSEKCQHTSMIFYTAAIIYDIIETSIDPNNIPISSPRPSIKSKPQGPDPIYVQEGEIQYNTKVKLPPRPKPVIEKETWW